ncbi:MAG TPA: PaaX family transcriptional regulator C-terminal domain-containing protein [Solirubrobacteraceae bacterium]|nr:PaaX family transcriptional regulator C-terminal domain-containing protein [Solirubrobacteraceae bacterium]
MDDQLRRRSVGAPAARSLLLTVLGEYVLLRPDGVWQETLVAAMVSLGYTEQTARQALSRSARDGWLSTERRGRRARMTLTPRTSEFLRAGAERIYSFAQPWEWDGRWLLVVLRVPEERRAVRHQVRSRLAWAGLGSLGGGLWLTPHVEREGELAAAINDEPAADARSFVAELGSMGNPQQLVADAWDLERVREQYAAFIDDFSGVRALTPEACFRQQTLLVHAWRKFPFLDPDLPADLLPSDWPRGPAHDLFVTRHERWRAKALAHFAQLEDDLVEAEGQAA